MCISTGVYVCRIYTVCASNSVKTFCQVLTLKVVWKFRPSCAEVQTCPLPLGGRFSTCEVVRLFEGSDFKFCVTSSSHVQKNTRDLSCSLWSLGRCLGPAGGRSRPGRWTLWWRRCGCPSAPTPSLWGHPGEPRPRPPRTWWCLVVWRRYRF